AADVLFYHGLNIEGGKGGRLMRMVDSVGQNEDTVYSFTESVHPMYIGGDDEQEADTSQHSSIDLANGIDLDEDMRDAPIQVEPDHADAYEECAEEYLDKLNEINDEYEEKLAEVPEDERYLVTSERAFQYLADHFDLEEGYI